MFNLNTKVKITIDRRSNTDIFIGKVIGDATTFIKIEGDGLSKFNEWFPLNSAHISIVKN